MAPIGAVVGTDRIGNYKVRPPGGRSAILTRSAVLSLEPGRRVDYEVTSHGDYVDFSERYSVLGQGEVTRRTQESIDLVLWDINVGSVLVVGNKDIPRIAREHGDILGKRYSLTSERALKANTVQEIADSLGVDVEKVKSGVYPGTDTVCCLEFVWTLRSHPDRREVERLVRENL